MGCILEQQTFTGKLCCSPLTCLGSTGPCSCVKLCNLCLLLRKTALESMFCRIWHWVAVSFCWCSCHPSAALYSASLLDKVSSALQLFLLRAFYVPSESIFWASDTFFGCFLKCLLPWAFSSSLVWMLDADIPKALASFITTWSSCRGHFHALSACEGCDPEVHLTSTSPILCYFLEITYPWGVFWFFLKSLLSFHSS